VTKRLLLWHAATARASEAEELTELWWQIVGIKLPLHVRLNVFVIAAFAGHSHVDDGRGHSRRESFHVAVERDQGGDTIVVERRCGDCRSLHLMLVNHEYSARGSKGEDAGQDNSASQFAGN